MIEFKKKVAINLNKPGKTQERNSGFSPSIDYTKGI